MNIFDFTAQQLNDNIRKVLTDNSYKERISLASEIFKSRRDTPVERVAYWIEHVTKFGGDHLRSAGNDLPLYQYLMLDIIFVLLIALIVLTLITSSIMTLCLKKYRASCFAHWNKSLKLD